MEPASLKKVDKFTESHWSEAIVLHENDPYLKAKYLQEKTLLDFAKENEVEIVTICPAMMVGPTLVCNIREKSSLAFVGAMLDGRMAGVPRI